MRRGRGKGDEALGVPEFVEILMSRSAFMKRKAPALSPLMLGAIIVDGPSICRVMSWAWG